jgi:predicted MFS family arabinose efflux permease
LSPEQPTVKRALRLVDREPGAPVAVRRVLALVTLAVGVGQGFGRFVFPALLPAMKHELLGSYSAAGFLGTANVAAYLVGALAVMVISLRRPAHHILIGGLGVSTLGMVLLATAPGFAQLVAGMACTGLGGAAVFITAPGIVGSVVGRNRRGVAIGLLNAGIGAALVFGTQLARFASRWWGPSSWREVWAIMAAITAATLAATAAWLRPAPLGPMARPRLSALRRVAGWKPYLGGYFAFGFGYVLVTTYTVSALRDRGGFSVAHASNVYVLIGLGVASGGLVLGRLSDRIGRPLTLVLGYSLCALCPVGLLTYQEPYVAVSAFGFGLLFSGSVAVVAAYAADSTSPIDTAAAFALVTVAFSAAQAFGPQVGGLLIDHAGGAFTATFAVSGAALACAALLSIGIVAAQGRRPVS